MLRQEAIDPVCGMTLATQGALTREHDGKTYYFCSAICADRFDADAPAFVAASRMGLDGWGRTPAPDFPTGTPRRDDHSGQS